MGNARKEAHERLGGRYETRVLEPSPPAVDQGPWFADDPAARGEAPIGMQVVGPTSAADIAWDVLCTADPELAQWCSERWLGAFKRLSNPPAGFDETRRSLQMVAEHVLATARHRANGKIGLRFTRGGFGTPFFGSDEQVRIEGGDLVHQVARRETRHPLTTAQAAADAIGISCGAPEGVYEPSIPLEPDRTLEIAPDACAYLGDLYGFATLVLEELRALSTSDERVSRVQLWPEHFDVAIELGDESCGARAGYGVSPGDGDHPEPYLYVVPWGDCPSDPWWNATYFDGARCDLSEMLEKENQRATALAFFEEGRRRLHQQVSVT
jgi:hypothetical protein